jgi:hypothetical protein
LEQVIHIFGCSASQRVKVNKCYGDFLSDKLSQPLNLQAAGCGSNYRIARVLSNQLKTNQIASSDLVIIQYTESTRNEFFTYNVETHPKINFTDNIQIREDYTNGQVIRYKAGAGNWQPSKIESKFFNLYEKNFLNPEFEDEKFSSLNFQLQCMLAYKKVNAYFLLINGYTPDTFDTIDYFSNRCIQVPDPKQKQLFIDDGHFHETGHKYVANLILKKITSN